MSGKGFGKQADDDIQFSSIVSSKTGNPFVIMKWGKEEGKLTPQEAMAHGAAVMQTAMAAILDAQIVQWAMQKLDMPQEKAVMLLRLFRDKRETGKLPSLTLNIDGEHLRPETVKKMGCQFLEMAFMTEAEAFLAAFLLEDVGTDPSKVDVIIQEFREMRGAITLWSDSSLDNEEG
jgi:hypothetical protein